MGQGSRSAETSPDSTCAPLRPSPASLTHSARRRLVSCFVCRVCVCLCACVLGWTFQAYPCLAGAGLVACWSLQLPGAEGQLTSAQGSAEVLSELRCSRALTLSFFPLMTGNCHCQFWICELGHLCLEFSALWLF